MLRATDTFPLAPSVRAALKRAGFQVAKDVIDLSPLALASELGITREEALGVLKVIRGEDDDRAEISGSSANSQPKAATALELLEQERRCAPITTFSANLDGLLSGHSVYRGVQKGVARGCVTEFCGAPGIGKTQLCMQLAVGVQIPEALGGAEGEAVFIDTEGSFIVERIVQIAKAAVQHVMDIAESYQDEAEMAAAQRLSVESILKGIYYFRVHSYIEQVALIRQLPQFVAAHPSVKLIVMDSIAFHFRGGHKDFAQRSRLLHLMSQQLSAVASSANAAVVLTNQMTTKINAGGSGAQLVPALGESWGHACTNRIILYWEKGFYTIADTGLALTTGRRNAHMYKSSSTAEGTVQYDITSDGVRDPPEDPIPAATGQQQRMPDADDEAAAVYHGHESAGGYYVNAHDGAPGSDHGPEQAWQSHAGPESVVAGVHAALDDGAHGGYSDLHENRHYEGQGLGLEEGAVDYDLGEAAAVHEAQLEYHHHHGNHSDNGGHWAPHHGLAAQGSAHRANTAAGLDGAHQRSSAPAPAVRRRQAYTSGPAMVDDEAGPGAALGDGKRARLR